MAANLTTFFTRLGGLADMAEAVRTHQDNLDTKMTNVVSNYSDANMHYLSGLVKNLQRHIDDAGRIFHDIQSAATNTLLETFDDDPEAGAALETKTIAGALDELRRQMITQSKTISRGTQAIAATSAAGDSTTPRTGNGTMILTALAPLKETGSAVTPYFQSVKQEQIRATCVADAGVKRVSALSEEFIVRGQRSVPRSSREWPKGSGLNHRVTVTSPNINGGSGPGQNICTNSNFESWTSNVPDNWELTAGTAGTDIVPTTGYEANGTTGLEFDNNGATCTLKQTLDGLAGTLGSLKPDTPYLISFSIRELGTVNAGTVNVTLKNSGGTTLHNGDALRECSLNVAHGSFTTAHVRHSNVVWTPLVIGKGAYIELTAVGVTSGTEVFVDSLVIAEMHRPIRGGVAFAIVPGTTDFVLNDQMTSAVTNALGGSNVGEWARELNRFYNTETLGIAIPDSGSSNIADSLIE